MGDHVGIPGVVLFVSCSVLSSSSSFWQDSAEALPLLKKEEENTILSDSQRLVAALVEVIVETFNTTYFTIVHVIARTSCWVRYSSFLKV